MFENLKGKKFGLIYADPPWRYGFTNSKSRAIENQYPTMSLDDICEMPVQDISEEDCILYMWTTAPKLEEGLKVLNAWGFRYITNAIWDKQKMGRGYYFRIQHELLLVGKKGWVKPPPEQVRMRSVLSISKTSKHSEKPAIHYVLDTYHPELKKIELFARQKDMIMQLNDWSVWGNEV